MAKNEYTTLKALQMAIHTEVQNKVAEIEQNIHQVVNEHLIDYYHSTPQYYKRTGLMRESPKSEVTKNGNQYQLDFYLDTDYQYPTGTWSAQRVITEANQGNLIGQGGFWDKTVDKIPEIIEKAMKK